MSKDHSKSQAGRALASAREDPEAHTRFASPVISAVVFGLALFLVLIFGGGSLLPSDEEPVVAAAAGGAPQPSRGEALFEPQPSVRAEFRGLMLDPPKQALASYRERGVETPTGLVVDEAGETLAGAELIWAPLGGGSLELRATTGWRGRFSFEAPPRKLIDDWSCVWVLHPTHYAELILVEPGGDLSAAFGGVLRLEAAPTFRATVVDGVGAPVIGAEVSQELSLRVARPVQFDDPSEPRFVLPQRLLQPASTDSMGDALLMPVRTDSTLKARSEERRSAPLRCESEGQVELELCSTFEALGSVRGSLSPGTLVRCEAVAFGALTYLGEFPVSESGQWGPASLPLMEVEEYLFSLSGDLSAIQVRKPLAEVTSRLFINFEAVSGHTVPLLISGPRGPLEGAEATVHWKREGSWQSVCGAADEGGLARPRGVPAGNVYARVHHVGHVSRMIGPFEVSPEMEAVEVELELAGQISGRCLRGGEPVQSFQLLYWSGDPSQVAREEVRGSEDGSFLIEEAPLGEVTILGLDGVVANGEPSSVVVQSGQVSDITIELPEARGAIGEIVDAVTGEPVSGARVQVMSAYDGLGLAEFGPEVSTDMYGGFAVRGLPLSVGALRIQAKRYIDDFIITRGDDSTSGDIDLGVISLQPARELVVQLDGPEGTFYSGFRIGLVGAAHLGVRDASRLGVVRFEDVPNGVVELNVYHPDQTITAFATSLGPEDDGRVLVPVPSGHRLRVKVIPRPGTDLPLDLFVGVGGRGQRGSEVVRWLRDEGMGGFVLEDAQPGPVVIRAVARSGDVYAIRRFDQPSGGDAEVQLELGEEDDFVVRVIDAEDRPVQNAVVSVYLPRTDHCFFVRNLITGADGEVRVQGFGFSHAQVTVSHETRGAGDVGYVDVASLAGEALVVRLEAAASLCVVVQDGGEPVVSATAALSATEPLMNGASFGERRTSQDGEVSWDSLMTGDYELYVHGVGLWATRARLEARPGGARRVLEVRRTGQLSLAIFNGRGQPVQGAEIELSCAELGASLSAWVHEGRVVVSSLITDETGRLTLPPVPRGSWVWSATSPDGRVASGVVELPAGTLVEVVGVLP